MEVLRTTVREMGCIYTLNKHEVSCAIDRTTDYLEHYFYYGDEYRVTYSISNSHTWECGRYIYTLHSGWVLQGVRRWKY
jgi:hypothetical protein